MDAEIDIPKFVNCTRQLLSHEKTDNLNFTQLLDLLPSKILDDISLNTQSQHVIGTKSVVPPNIDQKIIINKTRDKVDSNKLLLRAVVAQSGKRPLLTPEMRVRSRR
ncbi:unnamed protein product [Plutella xylostella]|uniref:(diamondback moth) hypothetical protein n=1 Tax=Plutella xylostella TaxID=51655 RepID=A0A8S4G4G6_PLUXY|nr:unnamed protein product [Plutella xylostella]